MSMKKIIAGVAAAALTVGSLAVVGVSAENDVKTFNFVGQTGSMKVSYSATVSYLGGLPVDEVFPMAGGANLDFSYTLTMGMNSGYSDKNLANVQAILNGVKIGDGSKITVTGVNELGRTVTATVTAGKKEAWNTTPEGVERIRIRKVGDGLGAAIYNGDLDLSIFDTIRSVNVTNTFSIDTQGYYVPAGVAHVDVANTMSNILGGDFTGYWQSYTSESKDNNGKVITAGNAYALEGAVGDDKIEIGADATGSPIYAISLGSNTLRWVNDNIVQNKGAKLKINFMTPSQLKDAITGGNISQYPTLIEQGGGSQVLTPGSSSTTVANDITIGVNLKNTTKLQQTTNIVDYTAEFDWDTLVQNSASTVSGNVDSIAFRIARTDNVSKTIADSAWNVGIKSIEIVIPDQASVPGGNDPARVITAGSADTFVKLIGTEKTIYGNGATEVAVENNITNNNVSYAVKLMDANGSYVQPAGEVTLQLSIPTDFRGATLTSNKVRHTCNDGTVEELDIQNFETYKTDNYIVVKTSKFSDFSFGFETTEATEAPATEAPATEAPATEAPATEAPATEAPSTGNANSGANTDKNAPTGVVLAVVPAAVAAAAVVISKKRK